MSDMLRVSLGAALMVAVLVLLLRLGLFELLLLPLLPMLLLLLLLLLLAAVTVISLAQVPSTEQRPSEQVRSPTHCSSTTSVLRLCEWGPHMLTKTPRQALHRSYPGKRSHTQAQAHTCTQSTLRRTAR